MHTNPQPNSLGSQRLCCAASCWPHHTTLLLVKLPKCQPVAFSETDPVHLAVCASAVLPVVGPTTQHFGKLPKC
eukprot:1156149-Pelagomonas_calceolata.AAC.5